MNSKLKKHFDDFLNDLNSIDSQCVSNQKIYVTGSWITKMIQFGLIGINSYSLCKLNYLMGADTTDKLVNHTFSTLNASSWILAGIGLADFCLDHFKKVKDENCQSQVRDKYKILLRDVNSIHSSDEEVYHALEKAHDSFLDPKISTKTSPLYISFIGLVKHIEGFIFSFTKYFFNNSFKISDMINYLEKNDAIKLSGAAFFLYEGSLGKDQLKYQLSVMIFMVTAVFVFHAYHLLLVTTSRCQLRQKLDNFTKSIKKYAPTASTN